jgi:hypothetical protein
VGAEEGNQEAAVTVRRGRSVRKLEVDAEEGNQEAGRNYDVYSSPNVIGVGTSRRMRRRGMWHVGREDVCM